MMKEIYEILSDEEHIKKLTRTLYISKESIKMISETAKLAAEKEMPLIEFKQRCNGFCNHELVNALYLRAKHETEAQELTPEQRVQILSDLLAAHHYETKSSTIGPKNDWSRVLSRGSNLVSKRCSRK